MTADNTTRVEDVLLPQHLADLRRSGLSDEQIIRAKLRSMSDAGFIAGRLGRTLTEVELFGPCLAFPFLNAEGKNAENFTRFKPDSPPKNKNGKPQKYLSPTNKPNRLYIPPGTWPAPKDVSVELLMTEGEKKALKADQEGFPCVGITGVWNWVVAKKKEKTKGERKQPIPDMLGITWAGRKVTIVFDSDLKDNDNVRYALRDLAAALTELGASVFVVFLSSAADGSKVGLDDYLVAHSPDQFRELLGAAKPLTATAPTVESDAGEHKPIGASKKTEGDEPDNPHRLAAELLGEGDSGRPLWLRFWRETFYEWTGAAYRKLSDATVKAKVTNFARKQFVKLFQLQMLAYQADPSEDKKRPITKNVTGELVGNVLNALRSLCALPDEIEPPVWVDGANGPDPRFLLAGPNGMLDVAAAAAGDVVRLNEPDPDLFNLVAVDYPLQTQAAPPKQWLKFLSDLWPDDTESVQCLQEWFGYVLSGDTSQQKMLWLIGPSRAGKGVINYVLTQLIGVANVCTPSLYSFGTEFGLSSMLGKSLAVVGDGRLSNRADAIQVTAQLLQIVGEDGIDVNRKNKPIVENTRIGARVVVAANELPALVDNADAMMRRSLVLRLTKTFSGREDTALREKLKTELPSIALWAIEGLANLRLRGRFSEPTSGSQLKHSLGSLLSPVGVFVRERCVVESDARVERNELFRAWKSWCEEQGKKEAGTQAVFGRNLNASISTLGEARVQDPHDRKRRPWCYVGLRLRTIEEGDPHTDMITDRCPGGCLDKDPGQARLFFDDELAV